MQVGDGDGDGDRDDAHTFVMRGPLREGFKNTHLGLDLGTVKC